MGKNYEDLFDNRDLDMNNNAFCRWAILTNNISQIMEWNKEFGWC